MERPQMIGGEECHSSESGWTMYIGSPIDDDDDDDGQSDDDDGEDNDDHATQADDAEDESDDSMASDASSGPSHLYGNPWGNNEGGYGLADSQQATDDHEPDEKFCRDKKENKRKGKKVAEKRSEEKNGMVFINKKSKAPGVQGHDKVRKNFWVDRKK